MPWNKMTEVLGCHPDVRIPELNSLIKEYAQSSNLVYLDYFKALTDGNNGMQKNLAYDGVHPNKSGYKVMAPLTQQAIDKALSN